MYVIYFVNYLSEVPFRISNGRRNVGFYWKCGRNINFCILETVYRLINLAFFKNISLSRWRDACTK